MLAGCLPETGGTWEWDFKAYREGPQAVALVFLGRGELLWSRGDKGSNMDPKKRKLLRNKLPTCPVGRQTVGKAWPPCSHPICSHRPVLGQSRLRLRDGRLCPLCTSPFRSTEGTPPDFSPAPTPTPTPRPGHHCQSVPESGKLSFWSPRLPGKPCAEHSAKQERGRVTPDMSKNSPHLNG